VGEDRDGDEGKFAVEDGAKIIEFLASGWGFRALPEGKSTHLLDRGYSARENIDTSIIGRTCEGLSQRGLEL